MADGLYGYFPPTPSGTCTRPSSPRRAEAELGGIERRSRRAAGGHPGLHAGARVHRHGARMETPDYAPGDRSRAELDALIAHLERSYLAAA